MSAVVKIKFFEGSWAYSYRAASLAGSIEEIGLEVNREQGSIGQFDIICDGKLVFSKQKEGRFPEIEEMLKILS